MKIVLATRNKSKAREIQEILKDLKLEILTLNDFPEIPTPIEDGKSFKENALKKARFFAQRLHLPALADDSGLEVEALNKRPGILSARYARSEEHTSELQSRLHLVCRLLLEKKTKHNVIFYTSLFRQRSSQTS